MTTKAGDVDLRIPKLRKGSFFPSILERRRRIDRASRPVHGHSASNSTTCTRDSHGASHRRMGLVGARPRRARTARRCFREPRGALPRDAMAGRVLHSVSSSEELRPMNRAVRSRLRIPSRLATTSMRPVSSSAFRPAHAATEAGRTPGSLLTPVVRTHRAGRCKQTMASVALVAALVKDGCVAADADSVHPSSQSGDAPVSQVAPPLSGAPEAGAWTAPANKGTAPVASNGRAHCLMPPPRYGPLIPRSVSFIGWGSGRSRQARTRAR